MKKILFAGLMATTLMGCGLAEELAERAARLGKLNAGKVTATGYGLAQSLVEVQKLSGGVAGFAPSLQETGGGVSLAPAVSFAPGFRPAAETLCDWVGYAGPVTVTETYAAEKEEDSAVITLYLHCAGFSSYPTVTTASAETEYKDGSTGTTFISEIDVNDDVTTGYTRLALARYFNDNDKRKRFVFEAEVDLLGSWDAPNKWRYGKYVLVMQDGTEITAEVEPVTPITDGEDFTEGTATRKTVYASGDLKITSETAEITGKDTGTYTLVNEYADGTKDTFSVSADGNVVTLEAAGRDGYTRTGSLQLASGEYELVTTFPANLPISKVTESGKWHKNATQGTYNRVIEWADGHTTETQVTANVNGTSLSATFTHEDVVDEDKADRISGSLDIDRRPTEIEVHLEISNDAGDKATLHGTMYADNTASLTYTKDLKETAVNPDEEGTFTFNADGSGSGTVTANDEAGSTTYDVTINADGTGTIKEQGGSVTVYF